MKYLLLIIVALGLLVLVIDLAPELYDQITSARARAEAERALAQAQLTQAQGDLAIKEAAARAVEADTTVATMAALAPLLVPLSFFCYGIPIVLGIWVAKGCPAPAHWRHETGHEQREP